MNREEYLTMMKREEYLTAERLRELITYEPSTGVFTWKMTGRRNQGKIAGHTPQGEGRDRYTLIGVDKRMYYAHRLAWLYTHGVWPVEVDHKNEIKTDNRIKNLRAISHGANLQNQTPPQCNTSSGYRGVRRRGNRFVAEIRHNRITKYLGTFDDAEIAHEAYLHAKRELHPFWEQK